MESWWLGQEVPGVSSIAEDVHVAVAIAVVALDLISKAAPIVHHRRRGEVAESKSSGGGQGFGCCCGGSSSGGENGAGGESSGMVGWVRVGCGRELGFAALGARMDKAGLGLEHGV